MDQPNPPRAVESASHKIPPLLGWVITLGLLGVALWLGQLFLGASTEASLLRQQLALADFNLRSARNQLEAERILACRQLQDAGEQVASLTRQLPHPGGLSALKVAFLTSQTGNPLHAEAVVIWDPATRQGVFAAWQLPPATAGLSYRLWAIDPHYSSPIALGTLAVDPPTGAVRFEFSIERPVVPQTQFGVSIEPTIATATAGGPMVLLSR